MRYRNYTTLDELKRHRDISSANTKDDTFLTWLIQSTSAVVDTRTNRFFVPEIETRYPTHKDVFDQYMLRVTDLLDVSSVVNANSAAIGSYDTMPYDHTPYNMIVLDSDTWTFPTLRAKVTVAGTWGYHDNYLDAWQDATTVSGSIDDSVTSVAVADASDLEALQLIRVENELMHISAISSNTLTVARGVNGSSAAAHSGAGVEIFKPIPDIVWAVTEMGAWLYKNRDRVNEYVQFAEGGGVRIGDLAPEIIAIIDKYKIC